MTARTATNFRAAALLTGAALMALATAPALAQATDEAAAASDDVVIVKATRTNLTSFNYPGLTSVITLGDLQSERPGDLSELLENVPGLEVSGGPRRTGQTLSLRGLGRQNITLLLDGARQNFASAHDGAVFLDPALLGRVETVRGPASALYGSGAAGGVVAFETLDADDLLEEGQTVGARASAGYRSVNEETRGVAALVGRTERASGTAGLALRRSGDIELGSGDNLPASDEIFSALLQGEVRLGEALTLDAGWTGFRNEAVEPNNGQGASTVSGLNPLVRKDVASDSFRATLGFQPGHSLIDLDTTIYHNLGEVDEYDPLADRTIERDLTTTGLRAENRARFSLAGREAALVTGAEWYRDEQEGFDSATPSGARGGVPNGTTDFYGVYAQLEAEFDAGALGSVILVPGVRWDRFESESDISAANRDEAVSPRVAATWKITEDVNLFASWSEGFRAPSLNELYLDGTHFSLPHPILGAPNFITNEFIANPGLEPEKTETIEIGAAWRGQGLFAANDRLEVKGAWYRIEADNLINLAVDFAFDPACFAPPFFAPCSAGTSFSENVETAELEGFEIAARYDNGPLTLSGAVYEVDGENTVTGAPLGALQPVRGYIDAAWHFETLRLDTGVRVEIAGDFDKTANPAEERDGYTVVDLRTSWYPAQDRSFRIDAGVENIFEEDYERVFAGVSEAGRSVRIDLTWTGAW